jgi:uncharacterized membrane protein YraQ (UPF0718 family)
MADIVGSVAGWAVRTGGQVWTTLGHNWPFLLMGAVVAAALKPALDARRVGRWLRRHRKGAVLTATGLAVATPLCSCGTFAVVLGMLASTVPWAPIVAFLVASPLTSPTELIYSAGLFGWRFALAFFGASIALGVGAGAVAAFLEERGWFEGQARLAARPAGAHPLPLDPPVGPRSAGARALAFGRDAVTVSARLLGLFLVFAFLGYGVNDLLPSAWVASLFGPGHVWSVPLAATLGVPLYVNTEASLPLVRTFLDSGASAGATLAFLITGAGTSFGAVAGALTIARSRVIGLVVGSLWTGAIVTGWAYDLLVR